LPVLVTHYLVAQQQLSYPTKTMIVILLNDENQKYHEKQFEFIIRQWKKSKAIISNHWQSRAITEQSLAITQQSSTIWAIKNSAFFTLRISIPHDLRLYHLKKKTSYPSLKFKTCLRSRGISISTGSYLYKFQHSIISRSFSLILFK
jgi:hypothetical protein